MVFLKDVADGRDNNLNLIRAFAATAVLVSHAYPITLGPGAEEPLKALTGRTLGGLSVFAFFVISGFLISMSFMRSSSWQGFLVARFLRLVPGLVVSLLLVAFLLGPVVTTLSLGAYFTDPQTYGFVIRNTMLVFLQYDLPGVFETQPYPNVEGSIWTLIYEVACYMGVFVLGIVGMLRSKVWMALGFAAYLGVWFFIEIYGTMRCFGWDMCREGCCAPITGWGIILTGFISMPSHCRASPSGGLARRHRCSTWSSPFC